MSSTVRAHPRAREHRPDVCQNRDTPLNPSDVLVDDAPGINHTGKETPCPPTRHLVTSAGIEPARTDCRRAPTLGLVYLATFRPFVSANTRNRFLVVTRPQLLAIRAGDAYADPRPESR